MMLPDSLLQLHCAAASSSQALVASIDRCDIILRLRHALRLRAARAINMKAPLIMFCRYAAPFACLQVHLALSDRLKLSQTCFALYESVTTGPAICVSLPGSLDRLPPTTWSRHRKRCDNLWQLLGRVLTRAPDTRVALSLEIPLSGASLESIRDSLHKFTVLNLDFTPSFPRAFTRRQRGRQRLGGVLDHLQYLRLCIQLLELLGSASLGEIQALRLCTDFPRASRTAGDFLQLSPTFASRAPELRALYLEGIALPDDSSTGSWGNLTFFHYALPSVVQSVTYEDLLNILEAMPSLNTLSMTLHASPTWLDTPRALAKPHRALRNVALALDYRHTDPSHVFSTLCELVAFLRQSCEAGSEGLSVSASQFSVNSDISAIAANHDLVAMCSHLDIADSWSHFHTADATATMYLRTSYILFPGMLSRVIDLSLALSFLEESGPSQLACPAVQHLTLYIDRCWTCDRFPSEADCCESAQWLPRHSNACQYNCRRADRAPPSGTQWDCPALARVTMASHPKVGGYAATSCATGCRLDEDLLAFVRTVFFDGRPAWRVPLLVLFGLRNMNHPRNTLPLAKFAEGTIQVTEREIRWPVGDSKARRRAWMQGDDRPASFFDSGYQWPSGRECQVLQM